MSCCPPGSWPALNEKYELKGKEIDIGKGLMAYVIGTPPEKDHHGTAIIVYTDVFGVDGGRIKPICDQLSEQGYFVVCPDFFRGKPYSGIIDMATIITYIGENVKYDEYRKDFIDIVLPYVDSKKIDKIGLIGFCLGSWIIFKFCADEKIANRFQCGVNVHPSIIIEKLHSIKINLH